MKYMKKQAAKVSIPRLLKPRNHFWCCYDRECYWCSATAGFPLRRDGRYLLRELEFLTVTLAMGRLQRLKSTANFLRGEPLDECL